MNCPEKDSTVRYSKESEKEGRNAGWRKYSAKEEAGTTARIRSLSRDANDEEVGTTVSKLSDWVSRKAGMLL